ncbi:MAG: GNAT family N-acetyltransferase [Planctomycetota bacterium]|nr:GNAT family N-acetyltransferase [Planctomycetota bacterium]
MGKLQLAGRVRDALRSLLPAGLNISRSSGQSFPPIEREGLTARCHTNWPDDPEFVPQWGALLKRNPWHTAFSSPVWQSAVVDEFVPGGEFRLVTVHRGKELLAVLPLALNTSSMLETPGRWVTDYLDPLVDSEFAGACWSIMLDLLSKLWDWSVGGIVLHHIRGDSPIRRLLPSLVGQYKFVYEESDVQQAPYIDLPATWGAYLSTLNGRERKELKRKIRNAQTRFGAKWQTFTTSDDCTPALERAICAMRQARSLKADFAEEILIGFLRRTCPDMIAKGDFYIQELSLEGRPAAWMLVIPSPVGPMIYNTSFEHAQRHLSPGAVAFGLAIQDAIAAGCPCFNFLRGAEAYKARFGAVDLNLIKVTIRPA